MTRSLLKSAPYLALGLIGAVGLFVATTQAVSGSPSIVKTPPPKPFVVIPAQNTGPFTVVADFDRRLLPRGGDAFLRVAVTGVKQPGHARLPAEVFLVIDRSGSMTGQKLADAKNAAKRALRALRPLDSFHVIAFGSEVSQLAAGTIDGDPRSLTATIHAINQLQARGGTNMSAALQRVELLSQGGKGDSVRRVMLLSDGHPDRARGLTDKAAALANRGIVTTTLGVGLDYNEDLMAAIADNGRGNYHFVEKTTDLASVFTRELSDLAQVVARDVVLDLNSPAMHTITPLGIASLEPRWDARGPRVAVGDVYAGRTVELLFRVPLSAFEGAGAQVNVRASSREGNALASAVAGFGGSPSAIAASAVEAVQVQAAQWQISQAMLSANAAYNERDLGTGNVVLDGQIKQVAALADELGNVELRAELEQLRQFRSDNNDRTSSRRSLNNYAKWKARDMNR